MKKSFLLLCLVLFTAITYAVPARRSPFTITQSDGTRLTLVLTGDEHLHYYEDVSTGNKYTRGDDGEYHLIAPTVLTEMRSKAAVRREESNARRKARLAPQKVGSFGSMKGDFRGLIILVNFKDVKFNNKHTLSTFDNMFNQEGYNDDGHIGSVADYFRDQSYGQFNLTFDVVGPVTLSQNMSYYGANDSYENDLRPGQMAKEACQKADALGVDFSQYDWDGDGYVDQVFVIYAGFGENFEDADPNTIWPHEWNLNSSGAKQYQVDGVIVNTYACAAELAGISGTSLNGMGTACHEFSHCLGYPDSYDVDYSGGIGMDSFDVMCGGSYNGPNGKGEVPCGYTAFQRMCAGWLDPVELSEPLTVTDMPDLGSSPTAYIIYNVNNSSEFLMFENRQSDRWFGYYNDGIAGHGLFVTHIDYNASVWAQNKPNDDKNRQRLTWIPADGKYGTYYSAYKQWYVSTTDQQGDFFPGTKKKTSLTYTSHSSVGGKWFTGTTPFKDITDISEASGLISFKYDGGSPEPVIVTPVLSFASPSDKSLLVGDSFTNAATVVDSTSPIVYTSSNTEVATVDSEGNILAVGVGETVITASVAAVEGVSYEASASYKVSVTMPTLASIAVKTLPTKLDYIEGETFSPEGLILTATYSNGYTRDIPESEVSVPSPLISAGQTSVEVFYTEGEVTLSTLIDITVTLLPRYTITFDAGTGECEVSSWTQTDYGEAMLLPSCTIANYHWQFAGWSFVSIEGSLSFKERAGGEAALFAPTKHTTLYAVYMTTTDEGTLYASSPDLVLTPVLSFASPSDKSLLVGDSYTNTAIVVDSTSPIVYTSSNTEVATVDSEGNILAVGLGESIITASVAAVEGISYEASASYKVTVSMPTLASIAVKTLPTKLDYIEGETFSPEGLVLTAIYSNGYTRDIPQSEISVPSPLISAGQSSVEVFYTEGEITVSTLIDITVTLLPRYTITFDAGTGECEVSSWTQTDYGEAMLLPSCTIANYHWQFAGWSFVSIEGSLSFKERAGGEAALFAPTSSLTLYAVYMTTTDEGTLYASSPDLVLTPALSFASPSDKSLLVGDSFTNAATVVDSTSPIVYTSSNTEVATVDSEGNILAVGVGETVITASVAAVEGISYEASASYKVTVTMPTLASIAVKTLPTKLDYIEGETFSPEGLVLTAIYSNGYTRDIPETEISVPSPLISAGQTSVEVFYTEGEITLSTLIDITVTLLPRYTITFDAGIGTCEVESLTQVEYQEELILPTCDIDYWSWQFAGWSFVSIEGSLSFKERAGGEAALFAPTSSLTLYAVYKATIEGETVYTSHPETTAIRSINAVPNDDRYYNLSGQPVLNPHGGIFIHHGRKVYVP